MVTSTARKWWALALLSVVQFMVVLDIAIVNFALPSIQADLEVLPGEPAMGDQRLRTRLRRVPAAGRPRRRPARPRRVFVVGLAVFAISSLLAELAWSEASLIAARALQGLGAAIISPAALSILTTTFSRRP